MTYRLKRRKAQREAREAGERVRKNLDDQVRQQFIIPDFLVVGENIWIGCKTHMVEAGDTVETIIEQYSTTIEYLCYSNGVHHVSPLTIIEWP